MDEDNVQDQYTEKLIEGMVSFLDDKDEEDRQFEKFDEVKNPLSWSIKQIINQFAVPPELKQIEDNPADFYTSRMHANQIENVCRDKDPYMLEVNRLMFASTAGHPPHGSPEYHQAAENYALFGNEFLDFPCDLKFPQPLNLDSLSAFSTLPSFMTKLQGFGNSPGFGTHIGKSTKQQTITSTPQQQILVNQTNYCSYPLLQVQNLMQPLIYANPYLMTQYLNTFVKETQINTSLVQQQQFLGGGIHERLLYAQMLQQQIQTNQAALMSSCFASSCNAGKCKQGVLKIETANGIESSSASLKPDVQQ